MRVKQIAILVCLLAACTGAVASSSDVIGSAYRADIPFPQFLHLWSEGWALKGKDGEPQQYASANMPLGAYVQIYIHNASTHAISITDVKLGGVSLADAIAFSDHKTSGLT